MFNVLTETLALPDTVGANTALVTFNVDTFTIALPDVLIEGASTADVIFKGEGVIKALPLAVAACVALIIAKLPTDTRALPLTVTG